MTNKELSQLYWLNREISADAERLAELEAVATGTASKITGLPFVSCKSDKTAIAAEIADVRTILQAKKAMAAAEYNRLNRYIASVEDSFMRQILTLRYINGLTWPEVADSIGGGNTENSVKKAHSRFLKKSGHTCHD